MRFSSVTDRLIGTGRTLLVASTLLIAVGPTLAEANTPEVRLEMEQAATEAQNKAIVRTAFEKWRAGGNVFTELLAPDMVWTIHGSGPVAGTYRGLKDFTEKASAPLVTRLATPITPEVHSIMADGDLVSVRFNGSATTTSGAPYRNQFVWLFRMQGGAVVEAEAFLDLTAYQRVVENNEPRAR